MPWPSYISFQRVKARSSIGCVYSIEKQETFIGLFLSMTPESNHNAVMFQCGLSAVFGDELPLPPVPPNSVRETNVETLRRLYHDLAAISRQELTALGAYRLYLPVDGGQASWGYGLEAARSPATNGILVLFRKDEEDGAVRSLRWLPFSSLCTVNQAWISYHEPYRGPTEKVMHAILHVFEFAVDTNWSYVKRLEFYHSFPFEELPTVDAVHRFRPILFGCPAFTQSIDIDN